MLLFVKGSHRGSPDLLYLISFGPDNSWRWLPCDLHIQAKFISCYYNDGVLRDHVSSCVQVDLWRIWKKFNIKVRQSACTNKSRLQETYKVLVVPELWMFSATHLVSARSRS